MCYLGWQESLVLLTKLAEAEVRAARSVNRNRGRAARCLCHTFRIRFAGSLQRQLNLHALTSTSTH